MYRPESEDLIPRSAPKPSATIAPESISKPTVPEVSILFNNDAMQKTPIPIINTSSKPSSYASWKKRCLPQVAFSTGESQQRSNVYPMRSIVTSASSASPVDSYHRMNCVTRVCTESPTENVSCSSQSTAPNSGVSSKKSIMTSPTVEYTDMSSSRSSECVLTICAGTQTVEVDNSENCATKQDISRILKFLEEIRNEQSMILMKLEEQEKAKISVVSTPLRVPMVDAATQSDILLPHSTQYNAATPLRPPIAKEYIHDDFSDDSSNNQRPIFHNTPPTNRTPRSNAIPMFPNANTEQSLVMNELALKYLPSEKLSDLLHEIRISSAEDPDLANSPLRNIENMASQPTDISSASYKYLKKYRLLPEEQNPHSPVNTVDHVNRYKHKKHLDLDSIRRQPKFL